MFLVRRFWYDVLRDDSQVIKRGNRWVLHPITSFPYDKTGFSVYDSTLLNSNNVSYEDFVKPPFAKDVDPTKAEKDYIAGCISKDNARNFGLIWKYSPDNMDYNEKRGQSHFSLYANPDEKSSWRSITQYKIHQNLTEKEIERKAQFRSSFVVPAKCFL